MSNLWFNIRFGFWHFQSSPDKWFVLVRNDFIPKEIVKRTPIAIHCLFGRHF